MGIFNSDSMRCPDHGKNRCTGERRIRLPRIGTFRLTAHNINSFFCEIPAT